MSAVALALAACASFTGALAAVFQSRGTKSVTAPASNGIVLLLSLVRSRIWLLGIAFAGVSGLFHALALDRGSLIEVESVMVTSLLFALALGIVVSRAPVSRRDWAGAAATILGLVAFLSFADPEDGDYSVPASRWIVVLAVLVVLVVLLVVVAHHSNRPNVRASVFATAAAVCLGTSAVLLKVLTATLHTHGPLVTLAAFLALLGLFELGALVFQQMAFRSGDLAAALAPFVGGNPMIAGAVGIVLFGERFHHGAGDLLGATAGIAIVVGGIAVLASSPLVAAGTGDEEGSRPAQV